MVYGGKLSKACEPCRTRRARCDLQQPACTQCLRAKRSCHGYRDVGGLRISDMSERLRKKFGARSQKIVGNDECRPPPHANRNLALQHLPSLTAPIEDRAFCFFRAKFVIGQSRSFNYLEEFYKQDYMSTHLALCIQAVSLACLSQAARSTRLENHARRVYIAAIRAINAVLASPDLAKNDGTMSAVMLLDQFERLIPPSNRSVKTWSNHLEGAAALMKIRGIDQFKTRIGLDMYAQMSSHFFVSCMEHEIPLPADFLLLRACAANFVNTTQLMWRLTEVTVQYIAFRATVHDRTLFDSTAIISAASRLDDQMERILVDLPPEFHCQTVQLASKSSFVLQSHYDFYADYQIAEALNMIRGGRIALFNVMIDEGRKVEGTRRDYFTLSLTPDCRKMILQAKRNLLKMTSVICACVPQLAGYLPHFVGDTSNHDVPSAADFRLSTSYTASAYTLLWPLFSVANSQDTSKSTRAWIIMQLRFIGSELDLERFLELAQVLESGVHLDVWKTYASIGSFCNYS